MKGISLPLGSGEYLRKVAEERSALTDQLLWLREAILPEERFGQIGGYGIDNGEAPVDLYRRVAISNLGPDTAIDADVWHSMDHLNEYLRHESEHFDANELTELKGGVQWIANHNLQIEAEASRWKLLCDFVHPMKSRLDFGGFEHLSLFIPSSDLEKHVFKEVIGQYRSS